MAQYIGQRCDSGALHFLDSLASDMTQEDPASRPTIQEAVRRLADSVAGLAELEIRSRLVFEGEAYRAKFPCRFRLKDTL